MTNERKAETGYHVHIFKQNEKKYWIDYKQLNLQFSEKASDVLQKKKHATLID